MKPLNLGESLWFPMPDGDCCALVAISGTYADERASGIMNMERTSWSDWLGRYPDTKFVFPE